MHCEAVLNRHESLLCLSCTNGLDDIFSPHTQDVVKNLFSSRVRPDEVYSLFRFGQGSVVQSMMHDLKYHGNLQIAALFGCFLSRELTKTLSKKEWCIVPVPMHPLKKRKRGFNQSEEIAKACAQHSSWQMDSGLIHRSEKGQTLTKLNRMERAELNQTLYRVKRRVNVPKSVILLDDVLTTGATLAACGKLLRELGVQDLILTSIAIADH